MPAFPSLGKCEVTAGYRWEYGDRVLEWATFLVFKMGMQWILECPRPPGSLHTPAIGSCGPLRALRNGAGSLGSHRGLKSPRTREPTFSSGKAIGLEPRGHLAAGMRLRGLQSGLCCCLPGPSATKGKSRAWVGSLPGVGAGLGVGLQSQVPMGAGHVM